MWKSGDIYFRNGRRGPTGIATRPDKVIEAEFASYRIVWYKINSDPATKEFCDITRLSEGPDVFLGWVERTVSGQLDWMVSEDIWSLPSGKTIEECLAEFSPGDVEGVVNFIIEGYVRGSEQSLEQQFNQAFEAS